MHQQALHGALDSFLLLYNPCPLPLVLPSPIHFISIVFFCVNDAQQNVHHGTGLAVVRAAVTFLEDDLREGSSIFNVSQRP